jgi:guanyl-specific ribonuclease Sa
MKLCGKLIHVLLFVLTATVFFACAQEASREPEISKPKSEVLPEQQTAKEFEEHGLSPEERSEIRKTLARISKGERSYRQDGSAFQNREKRLPLQTQNYYREYTVETPGAHSRAARRLVTGKEGELYYTNDHYRTFVRIDPRDYN